MTTPQVINATVTRTTPTFTVDGAPASPVIAPGTMPNVEGFAGPPATQDTKGYLALTDEVLAELFGQLASAGSAIADLTTRVTALENP